VEPLITQFVRNLKKRRAESASGSDEQSTSQGNAYARKANGEMPLEISDMAQEPGSDMPIPREPNASKAGRKRVPRLSAQNYKRPTSPQRNGRVYYKVIGESYIHNMMHGEAVKWQNDTVTFGNENRVLTEIFELR
jgi:hypothetical protein